MISPCHCCTRILLLVFLFAVSLRQTATTRLWIIIWVLFTQSADSVHWLHYLRHIFTPSLNFLPIRRHLELVNRPCRRIKLTSLWDDKPNDCPLPCSFEQPNGPAGLWKQTYMRYGSVEWWSDSLAVIFTQVTIRQEPGGN